LIDQKGLFIDPLEWLYRGFNARLLNFSFGAFIQDPMNGYAGDPYRPILFEIHTAAMIQTRYSSFLGDFMQAN
jgi:hypothetical protein